MRDEAAYRRHMAEHEPAGTTYPRRAAPTSEYGDEAVEAAREALLDPHQTPGEAERKHDEARRASPDEAR